MQNFLTFMLTLLVVILAGCNTEEKRSSAEHLVEAEHYLEKSDWPSALIALKNAARTGPENGLALYSLAKLYLELENPAAAEKELRKAKALKSPPQQLDLLLARSLLLQHKYAELVRLSLEETSPARERATYLAFQARAYIQLEQLQEAETLINKALSLNNKNSHALTSKAWLHFRRGDIPAAEDILHLALKESDSADAWSLLGDLKRYQLKLDEAIASYDKAVEQQVIASRDRLNRIYIQISKGDLRSAEKDLRFLRTYYDKLPGMDYAQGLIYLQKKKFSEAQQSFEQVLTLSQNFIPAHFYLGAAHFMQEHFVQAQHHLEKFITFFPDDINSLKMLAALKILEGELKQAETLARRALNQNPNDSATLNLLANTLLKTGQVPQGVEYLKELIAMEPDSAAAHMSLGMAMIHEGETEQGQVILRTAQALDPKIGLYYPTIIILHLQNKAFEEAIQVAKEYIKQNPHSPDALYLLGACYMASGIDEQGIASFQQALKLDPYHFNSLNALAMEAAGAGELVEAKAYYHKVLENYPNHEKTQKNLALLEGIQGNKDGMIRLLREAVESNPDSLSLGLSLARYYSIKNQPEKVIEALSEHHSFHPKNPALLALLGESELAVGNYSKAIKYLSMLSSLAPDNEWAHYLLAQAFAGNKESHNFRVELETVLEINSQHVPARINLIRLNINDKNITSAEKHIKELEKLSKDTVLIHTLKGEIAEAKADWSAAINHYKLAFEAAPSNVHLLRMENALWNNSAKKKALELMSNWLKHSPDDVLTLLRFAGRKSHFGELEEANKHYEHVLKLMPNNIQALNNLAWNLRDKNLDQALEYAERAYLLAPDSHIVIDTLAVLNTHKNPGKAEKLIARALDEQPDNLTYAYHQAAIFESAGKPQAAQEQLQRILSDNTLFAERAAAQKLLEQLRAKRRQP